MARQVENDTTEYFKSIISVENIQPIAIRVSYHNNVFV